MAKKMKRRTFLGAVAGATSVASFAILTEKSKAAEFEYKIGNDNNDAHPLNVRLKEAAENIKTETGGRLVFNIFTNSQLGGQTDMLSQLRSGGLQCFNISPLILATLVPAASISGVAFAFKDFETAFRAMDGDLGENVRAAISKSGIDSFKSIWNNGYRQVMTSAKPVLKPDDLRNLKLRVPVSPMWLSTFKSLGAVPATINWSETYSALQTKIVDGLDTSLPNADLAKIYEVQKYCAMTNHMWDGYLFLRNRRAWAALPSDLQQIAERNFESACMAQRKDYEALEKALRQQLEAKGLKFTDPNPDDFRDVLKTAGFYTQWHKQFGDEAWSVLEKYAGVLS
ncbi:Sialic acid-binding periplasmic protein SiaP [Methylobacterium crusticola]|uniref:Sialic acid-binding periplasmic protein SiaP n=1 Tax=Methylobacterium crusticola TaxID=1697972 RepID=A0ABQ4QR98_9HYPH|nr:TRAP transporter substrate-binding protein [Methylobacterium crusticola]GJD47803.1 Sialic acid-binding periplasmic protein SiaP [Methylobacterium crusticola]